MSFPQRLKAAMKGIARDAGDPDSRPEQDDLRRGAEQPEGERPEVESFARMQNVSEDVLRIIGQQPRLAEELRRRPRADEEPEDAAGDVDEPDDAADHQGSARSCRSIATCPRRCGSQSRKKVVANQSGKDRLRLGSG